MADHLNPDTSPAQTWDRVASELRAYRASQQQAWGDVDNATLGRYLAGELDGQERRQVEEALAAFPELHRLTTLVQDVLGEAEPLPAPSSVLSLAEFRAQQPARRAAPSRSRVRRWAPRLALLAAACLMLAVGLNLAWPGRQALRPREEAVRAEHALALAHSGRERFTPTRGASFTVRAAKPAPAPAPAGVRSATPAAHQADRAMLETAESLTNLGRLYQDQGDLARAEESFNRALVLCRDALGPDHRDTAQVRNNLADVYTAALNTVAATEDQVVATWQPLASEADAASEPKGGHVSPGGPLRYANPYTNSYAGSVLLTPGDTPLRVLAKNPDGQAPAMQAAWRVYADIASQKAADVRGSVLPVLVQALRDAPNPKEKARLTRAIGRLGPAAQVAVPALTACLHEAQTDEERRAALYALSQVSLGTDLPRARQAAPEIFLSLKSECPQARQLAAQVLVQVAPEARKQIYAVALRQKPDPEALDQVFFAVGENLKDVRQGGTGFPPPPEGARVGPRGVGVRDPYQRFTVHTLCEAQKQINRLLQDHDVKVRVETVPAPDLARTAEPEPLRGKRLHILIAQDGSDVRVACCPSLEKRGLRPDRLREIVREGAGQKAFDAGLLQGLAYLNRAVTE